MKVALTVNYYSQVDDSKSPTGIVFDMISEYKKAFDLEIKLACIDEREASFSLTDDIFIVIDFELCAVKIIQPLGLWENIKFRCEKFQSVCSNYFLIALE